MKTSSSAVKRQDIQKRKITKQHFETPIASGERGRVFIAIPFDPMGV
jgi:hypothetical protein